MGAWYTTRERVMASPDIRVTAYAAPRIDAAIEASSRNVDRLCHVVDNGFVPVTGSRSFPYPNTQNADSGRLWLDQHRLISLNSMTSGGVTVPVPGNVFLEPVNSGPPYTYIEINRATSSALAAGSGTGQRALVLTGVWGNRADEAAAGTITTSPNTSVTTISVDFAAEVGDLLRVDTERMQVIEKAWASSAQTGSLTAALNDQSLTVANGALFVAGEELLLDAERVKIRDIAGNNLIVQRAWSGSLLAAHTAVTVFWARSLTVTRGAFGTTAAAHSSGATVARHLVPGPVEELSRAYALDTFYQQGAGYARAVGTQDAQRQATGRAIADLEQRVYGNYGRMARARAV